MEHKLFTAVNHQRIDTIRTLLSRGANVNIKNYVGNTPLHIAVAKRNAVLVKFLIDNGADVNLKNNKNQTPLDLELQSEFSTEIMKFLVMAGGDVNLYNLSCNTPLHLAVKEENVELVKLLIESGADVGLINNENETPLHLTFGSRDITKQLAIIRILVTSGADVNIKNKNSKKTLLHIAVSKSDANLVKFLITRGLDPNAKDLDENTPLHYAVCNADTSIFKVLLTAGADINSKNKKFVTPLDLALKFKCSTEVIKTLVGTGGKVNIRNSEGDTLLHVAVKNRSIGLVGYLIYNKADVNLKNSNNDTPMDIALKFEYPKLIPIIKKLVDAGADINTASKHYCRTTLHVAVEACDVDLVKFCITRGADVNAKDEKNNTPLYYALLQADPSENLKNNESETPLHRALKAERSIKIIEILVNARADVNTKCINLKTPLHIAAEAGIVDLVQLCIARGVKVNAKDNNSNTPLHCALEKVADSDIVKDLLAAGADVNLKNGDGHTPMELMSGYYGKPAMLLIIRMLVEAGANVSESYAYASRRTALHSATETGDVESVKFLIKRGADVNAKDDEGQTALHYAARFIISPARKVYGHADKNFVCGDATIFKILLDAGADVNAKDEKNNTPLHYATENAPLKDASIFKVLLETGVDVNFMNSDRKTAIQILSRSHLGTSSLSYFKIIETFAKYGTNFNVPDHWGCTPMDYAVFHENTEMVKALFYWIGCDVNSICKRDNLDTLKRTLLHVACENFDIPTFKFLLKRGANLDAVNSWNETPLQCAIERVVFYEISHKCNLKMKFFMDYLLTKNPNINILTNDGRHVLKPNKYPYKLMPVYLWEAIIKYIVKLQAIQSPVHLFVEQKISSTKSFAFYFAKCTKEIEIIKNREISLNPRITLFDLLIENSKKLYKYAKNEELVKTVKDVAYIFPIYGRLIEDKFLKIVKKLRIRLEAEEILSALFFRNIKNKQNPEDVVKKILDYLRSEDMKKFSLAIKDQTRNSFNEFVS